MNLQVEQKVLALKYRPKRFDELIGQKSVSQTLALALDSDKLSHAYLFSGLRGSGKTSTARIFAKALICESGVSHNPCEVCENCLASNMGKHIDIIEMDAASNRKIDDIRDVIEQTRYKPSSAKYKIFIIDEVHMLTKEAFNALLKTLEEPPEYVKFILATTDPLKLPATILSRTQHFRFKKISHPDVVNHLKHILNIENVEFDEKAIDIIARSGNGSLRDTLTLLDQAIVYSKNSIDVNSVVEMLGILDPKQIEEFFGLILAGDRVNAIKLVESIEDYDSEMLIDELMSFLKLKLVTNDTRFSPFLLDRFFRIVSDCKSLLAIGSDSGFVLSLAVLKMLEALKTNVIDDEIAKVEKEFEELPEVEKKTVMTPPPPPAPKPEMGKTVEPAPTIPMPESVPEPAPIKEEKPVAVEAPIVNEPVVTVPEPTPVYEEPVAEKVIEEPPVVSPAPEVVPENTQTIEDGLEEFPPFIPQEANSSSTAQKEPQIEQTQEVVPEPEPTPVAEVIPQSPTPTPEPIAPVMQEPVPVPEPQAPLPPEPEPTPEPIAPPPPPSEPEPVAMEMDQGEKLFEELVDKLYDRDFELGACFKNSITYGNYDGATLGWSSRAEGECKDMLRKYWPIIKQLVGDVFGVTTQIKMVAAPQEEIQHQESHRQLPVEEPKEEKPEDNQNAGEGGSCVMSNAGLGSPMKSPAPEEILKDPFVEKAIKLLDPEGIRIRAKV